MWNMLALYRPFFGIAGPFGIIVGIIVVAVVCAILFKIFKLLMPALGVGEPWNSILYWVLVLVVFLWFVSYILGWY